MLARPEYTKVDQDYRQAQLESRNCLLHKASEADLWWRVIQRSVDDLVLFTELKKVNKKLTAEQEDWMNSAEAFLFDDSYRVPLDDYEITIKCNKCSGTWNKLISEANSSQNQCPHCGQEMAWSSTKYIVNEDYEFKTISLSELFDIWGFENLKGFRKGVRKYVKIMVKKRLLNNRKNDKTKPSVPLFELTSYTIEDLKKEKKKEYNDRYARRVAARKKLEEEQFEKEEGTTNTSKRA